MKKRSYKFYTDLLQFTILPSLDVILVLCISAISIWENMIEERVTNERQGPTAFFTCSDVVHRPLHFHWTEFIIYTHSKVTLESLGKIIGIMSVICPTKFVLLHNRKW